MASSSHRTPPGHDRAGQGQLSREDYTVGWICALPIELAASRAMFDHPHEPVPIDPRDTNSYQFGCIGHHNVVMVCLGEYGTNSAAHVATHMSRSFPSLAVRLMVGIAGGAPKAGYDLRLGDVVVGQRVMQYDQGKVLAGGQFDPNDVQQTVYRDLSSAISTMKAIHESRSTYIPEIINATLEANPAMSRYGFPTGLPDRLFNPDYDHDKRHMSCDECSSGMLVRRSRRSSQQPEIFYGAIASGNSIIRDSVTRDRLSHELDTVCFEMESAGFIGHFPCLVLRGICDYADSHKSKEWQRYAAATAAAYAKELLTSAIAPRKALGPSGGPPAATISSNLMECIAFDEMDSRKSNIKRALPTTCEWFLEHDLYLSWTNPQHMDRHGGFLWINGKAGCGKSTLMKFLVAREEMRTKSPDLIISFFFNARGQLLERSIEGMYRSLLYQLLSTYPDLQSILEDSKLIPTNLGKSPLLEDLKEILERAIGLLGHRSLVFYIDALDECAEDDIREMVYHFETLSQQRDPSVRVCFSSRPYPYVRLERVIRLDLNHQQGHHDDICTYVEKRLRSDHPKTGEIHQEILRKAAGTFMWVILVVQILSDDFAGERMFAVEERLNTLPPTLSDLFKQLCRRDKKNQGDFKLCLQWLLFSKRGLTSVELYYAICAGIPKAVQSGYLFEPISPQAAERFIISSSKGLAEVRRAKMNKKSFSGVQFIHESVRDFLIGENGLDELFPDLEGNVENLSHDVLKKCCHGYLESVAHYMSTMKESQSDAATFKFPFFSYAVKHVLQHAEQAAETISQKNYLESLEVSYRYWIRTANNGWKRHDFNFIPELPYDSHQSLAKYNFYGSLAANGLHNLILEWKQTAAYSDNDAHRHASVLKAALHFKQRDSARAALGLEKYKQGLDCPQDPELFGPSSWAQKLTKATASDHGQTSVPDIVPLSWASDLYAAAEAGINDELQWLIGNGPPVGQYIDARSLRHVHTTKKNQATDALSRLTRKDRQSLLSSAIELDLADLVILLIGSGAPIPTHMEADINSHGLEWEADSCEQLPLICALKAGSWTCAELLLHLSLSAWLKPVLSQIQRSQSDPTTWPLNGKLWCHTRTGRYMLELLVKEFQIDLLRHLVANGMDLIGVVDDNGRSPLHWAVEGFHFFEDTKEVIELLIHHGANVTAQDALGYDALKVGIEGKSPFSERFNPASCEWADLLLEHGAEMHAKTQRGLDAVDLAIEAGVRHIAELLIRHGADPTRFGDLSDYS